MAAAAETPVWPTVDAPVAGAVVSFYAMGDAPYDFLKDDQIRGEIIGDHDYQRIPEHAIARHIVGINRDDNASFFVHVGDIKRGSWPCEEAFYLKTWALLRGSKLPTFTIPGDNEWNDCGDTEASRAEAWSLWHKYFATYDDLWPHDLIVTRQDATAPDRFGFRFTKARVLFIGINLTGHNEKVSSDYLFVAEAALDWIKQSALLKSYEKAAVWNSSYSGARGWLYRDRANAPRLRHLG